MELCGRKKSAIWLWWAVDRATKRVLGWVLGDRDTPAAQALGAQIPRGPSIAYASDHYTCYNHIFPRGQHIKGKAYTYTIESMNNRLRCYLARLRRKTHCYSKSTDNLRDSLLFVFKRRMDCPLVPQTSSIVCPRLWSEDVSIPI